MAATSVAIKGLSGRGFRVPIAGALTTWQLCKEGLATNCLVDFTDETTRKILSRERDNFVVVTNNATHTAYLVGLSRRGFRVNENSTAVLKQVVQGDDGILVGLNHGPTKRTLKRQKRDFIRVPASGTDVLINIYGLQESQASFRITDSAANAFVFTGANNDISLVPLVPDDDLSFAIVDKGVTNASLDITTTGNAIEVSLAVTQVTQATQVAIAGGQGLLLTADATLFPGTVGNAATGPTVAFTVPVDDNQAHPIDVTVANTKDITVQLAVGADGSTVTSTAALIRTAILADPEASLLVVPTISGTGTSLGVPYGQAALTGGLDYSIDCTSKDIVDAINADSGVGGSGLLVEPFYEGTGLGKPETVAATLLSGGPQPLSKGETAVVDISDPFNCAQLRRHFRAWVEVL